MRHLALLLASAACLIMAAWIVDWRDFGWPDLLSALVVSLVALLLFGVLDPLLIFYVLDPLVSKRTISVWLWLEKTFRRKRRMK